MYCHSGAFCIVNMVGWRGEVEVEHTRTDKQAHARTLLRNPLPTRHHFLAASSLSSSSSLLTPADAVT